jgi:Ras-related GTP-binding protein C/D
MGLRRSGKTSIQKVVFHKTSPHETLFLESSTNVSKVDVANNSFVHFQIWDFPGQIDYCASAHFDLSTILNPNETAALVFVIDAQDQQRLKEAQQKLLQCILNTCDGTNRIVYEVMIHKVDGLSDEHKIELHRSLQQWIVEELSSKGKVPPHAPQISFHLTSIFDHSIFAALSRVMQKLIPQLPFLQNLLDMFQYNSKVEKCMLFDVFSKIFLATDSSPEDPTMYELCSDMIDVALDISMIYSPPAPEGTPQKVPFDEGSSCTVQLNNNMVLYMKGVNKYLALLCLVHKENFDRLGLINYNFVVFKRAVHEMFGVKAE